MSCTRNGKKAVWMKAIIVLLLAACFSMLGVPVQAAEHFITVEGLTNNRNGKIDITFDASAETMWFIAYDKDGNNTAYKEIPAGEASVEGHQVFDPAVLTGGDTEPCYLAVFPETDLPQFDPANVTAGSPGDTLELTWDAIGAGLPADNVSITIDKYEVVKAMSPEPKDLRFDGLADNRTGKIDLTFDSDTKPLTFIVYTEDGENKTNQAIAPGTDSVSDYIVFDPADPDAGDSVTLYMAIYPDEDIPAFDPDGASATVNGNVLELKWDTVGNGDPADELVIHLQKVVVAKAVPTASLPFTVIGETDNTDGKVDIRFERHATKKMYFVSYGYDNNGDLVRREYKKIPPHNSLLSNRVVYLMDELYGGQSVTYYMGLFFEEDVPGLETATPTLGAAEDELILTWDSGDAGLPQDERGIILQKKKITRKEQLTSITVLKENTTGPAASEVTKGEFVKVTIITNLSMDDISGSLFGTLDIAPNSSWTVAGNSGVYTYTSPDGGIIVPDLDGDVDESAEVEISFDVGGLGTFTQDSDDVNRYNNKLTYYAPFDISQLTTRMEKGGAADEIYIQRGETVVIHYESPRPVEVTSIVAGNCIITTSNFTVGNGYVSFKLTDKALSEPGHEGYQHMANVTVKLNLKDRIGIRYSDNEVPSTLTYVVLPDPEQNEFNVAGSAINPLCDDGVYYTEGGELNFTLYSSNPFGNFNICLTLNGARQPRVVFMERSWDEQHGSFKFVAAFDTDELGEMKDYDQIGYELLRGSDDTHDIDDNLGLSQGKSIQYLGEFELHRASIEFVPKYRNDEVYVPKTHRAYVVNEDMAVITIVANQQIIPETLELVFGGKAAQLNTRETLEGTQYRNFYYAAPQYYITDTHRPNDTIKVYFKLPKPDPKRESGYQFAPYYFQEKDLDEETLALTFTVKRYAFSDEKSVDTASYSPKTQNGQQLFHRVVYWAPLRVVDPDIQILDMDPSDLKLDDLDDETYVIVREGTSIQLFFTTRHPILTEPVRGISPIITKFVGENAEVDGLAYQEKRNGKNQYVHAASFTIGQAPLTAMEDQTIIKFIWSIRDMRGQNHTSGQNVQTSGRWAIYYTPLEITEATIVSSNQKDETRFCKDEDTILVSFKANHFVKLECSVIGKPGVYREQRRRHGAGKEYQFTYEIQNGDIEDLADITFAFSVADLYGDSFKYTEASPAVTNRLMYYAPVEATATIESNNARPVFAKNGDTITVSTTTNHEAQTIDFRIGNREIGDNLTYRENPTVSYRIPDSEEELHEGDIFFSVRVEDPAGNYELVSETAEEGEDGTKVIYDRTPPDIRILPGFNGYTNQDVGFTFLFNDMHLDLETVSCRLNNTERISGSAGEETSYTHNVELTEESEYSVSATAVDMAGNEMEFAATCNLIIDKTNPIIQMKLDRNTFPAGFTLKQITTIVEDNLSDLLCTVTDNQGVHDWSLEVPIDTEGKKTIHTMVRDMAGNSSVPIVYDIFIDGTAPIPQINNTANRKVFQPEDKNLFVGTTANLDISLVDIHIGDEEPDHFTTLQLANEDGAVVHDFLAEPAEMHMFNYSLPEYGNYTLLVAARDGVGNEVGPLMYMMEFRKMYILEYLLQGTPLANWHLLRYINDTIFFTFCGLLALATAGIAVLIIRRRLKKKKENAMKYIIVDDEG